MPDDNAEKKLQRLLSCAIRMMVGITGQSKYDCDWYDGIEQDGAVELEYLLTTGDYNNVL